MLAGYNSIYLEIASSAPLWLYNDMETLTTAFGTLPFNCYVDFLPPPTISYSQWNKLSKKGRAYKIFLLYESTCMTLPQVHAILIITTLPRNMSYQRLDKLQWRLLGHCSCTQITSIPHKMICMIFMHSPN